MARGSDGAKMHHCLRSSLEPAPGTVAAKGGRLCEDVAITSRQTYGKTAYRVCSTGRKPLKRHAIPYTWREEKMVALDGMCHN